MNKTAKKPALTPKAKYDSARSNLLLMIILTIINVVFAATGTDYMLLFSATVPYLFATLGTLYNTLMVPGIILALISIGVYFLCWWLSKKHYAWMIVALVLLSIDTIVMVAIYVFAGDFSGILDVIIHAWVMYYLIIGVINGVKLKKLPEEEIEGTLNGGDGEAWTVINGQPVQTADYNPAAEKTDITK